MTDENETNNKATITNTKVTGGLKMTKSVTLNGVATTDARTDGTYTFAIFKEDGITPVTTKKNGDPIGELTITMTGGVPSPAELTVTGLEAGTYVIRETGSTNSGMMLDADKTVVVTAGDTAGVPTAAFVNDYQTTSAKVRKIWVDENDKNRKRPNSLTVRLWKNNEPTETTVTLDAGNNWTDELTGLKANENGVAIVYEWHEENLPNGYYLSSVETVGTITTLTNTLSQYDLKTTFVGVKTWEDQSNVYHTRPDNLTVTLYANDVAQTELTPTWVKDVSTNQWTYTFADLPVFDNAGNIIIYRAEETVPGGYTKTTESSTATSGSAGEITWQNGRERIVRNNQVEWTLGSLIDLSFLAIKPTNNGDVVVWTHRVPVPYEVEAITNLIKVEDPLNGCSKRNIVFYHGINSDLVTPHGTVHVTQNGNSVLLDFGVTDVWAHFIVGQFNKDNSSQYTPGTASWTNSLETVNVEGTKTWNYSTEYTVTEPPVLRLTRTTEENTTPETVQVEEGVDLQPTWNTEVTPWTYSYTDLPKTDASGKVYTYSVEEVSFTVTIGGEETTYTTSKGDDGYYVGPEDTSQPVPDNFMTTQDGNNFTNGPVRATIEITKVSKDNRDDEHALTGAIFQLTKVDEEGEFTEGDYNSGEQPVGEDGTLSFEGLKPGRYKLVEVKAPDGYLKHDSPWFLIIDSTNGEVTLEQAYTMITEKDGEDGAFWVENEPGRVLPSTGGPGVEAFKYLGLMLILLGGVGLIRKKRREGDA